MKQVCVIFFDIKHIGWLNYMDEIDLDKLLVTKETFIKQVYDLEHMEIDLHLPKDFYIRAYLYKTPLLEIYGDLDYDEAVEKVTAGLKQRIIACLKDIQVMVFK